MCDAMIAAALPDVVTHLSSSIHRVEVEFYKLLCRCVLGDDMKWWLAMEVLECRVNDLILKMLENFVKLTKKCKI